MKVGLMDDRAVVRYLIETFGGVTAAESSGDTFLTYDPGGDLPENRRFPFATVVTGDNYDQVSDLNRATAYRLNLGLTKATYTSLFGAAPSHRDERGVLDTGFDYAAVDEVMPHPIYASQYWVCVVSPSDTTFEAVRPFIAEAYDFAARKYAKQQARRL
jgi:hypothetical protein